MDEEGREVAILTCYCGYQIPLYSIKTYVICPNCGRRYLYKRRSNKYVFAGG